jgi:phosphoribosylformylglycinamidine synthase I
MPNPTVVVLRAPGTNRTRETCAAIAAAGAEPRVVPIEDLEDLGDVGLVVIAGGFSYGDHLGAGRVFGARLAASRWFGRHVARGGLVLGVCNGFQALVAGGFLPGGPDGGPGPPVAALAPNDPPGFYCGWTRLDVDARSPDVFTRGLDRLDAPCAHAEGRLVFADDTVRDDVIAHGQAPLRYAGGAPNGSTADVAALCNRTGTVFGLMPHPEDHLGPHHHPTGLDVGSGLALLRNAVRAAAERA